MTAVQVLLPTNDEDVLLEQLFEVAASSTLATMHFVCQQKITNYCIKGTDEHEKSDKDCL